MKEMKEHFLLLIFYSLKWKDSDKRCVVTGINLDTLLGGDYCPGPILWLSPNLGKGQRG